MGLSSLFLVPYFTFVVNSFLILLVKPDNPLFPNLCRRPIMSTMFACRREAHGPQKRTTRPNAKRLSSLFMRSGQMGWDTFPRRWSLLREDSWGEHEETRPGRGEFQEYLPVYLWKKKQIMMMLLVEIVVESWLVWWLWTGKAWAWMQKLELRTNNQLGHRKEIYEDCTDRKIKRSKNPTCCLFFCLVRDLASQNFAGCRFSNLDPKVQLK